MTDNSKEFQQLEESLEWVNYSVHFEVRKFVYTVAPYDSAKVSFTITDLQKLFPGLGVEGEILAIEYEKAKAHIYKALSYDSFREGYADINPDLLVINQRTTAFWDIISKHFKLPPLFVFEHIPYQGSYFDDADVWGFHYLFLNEYQGLFIAGVSYT